MLALIDADIVTYKSGYASQHNVHRVYCGEEKVEEFTEKKLATAYVEQHSTQERKLFIETETEIEPLANCLHNVKEIIEKCVIKTKSNDYRCWLSPKKGNFREEIAQTLPYKGNRWSPKRRAQEYRKGKWRKWLIETEGTYTYQPKPYHYDAIREYLVKRHAAKITEGQEADDALGIAQIRAFKGRKYEQKNCKSVICSIDKDLRMIPGMHYDWTKDELVFVNEFEAAYNFYFQLLTGDSTDNVKGLPNVAEATRELYGIKASKGCGPAAASRILASCTTIAELGYAAKEAYFAYFAENKQWSKTDDYMLEQARLLWIRRKPKELFTFGESI